MKKAAKLVECGMIHAAVARELNISPSSVKKAVEEFGLRDPETKFGRKKKFPPELVNLAKRLKRKGMYSAEIVLEINRSTVFEVTKRQVAYMTKGTRRRPRGHVSDSKVLELIKRRINPKERRDKEIVKVYESGLSLREVANRFGISRERVRQIVIRNGTRREL